MFMHSCLIHGSFPRSTVTVVLSSDILRGVIAVESVDSVFLTLYLNNHF